jgi:excisionase family DNA binding protein
MSRVPEDLLTVAEVSRRLAICTASVYKLCATGKLEHVRVLNTIRVRPDQLAKLLAQGGK